MYIREAILLTAVAVTTWGCGQAKAPDTPPAKPSATAPSPGPAPSAVAVTPAPSDGPKGSMTHSPNEAGSALGGTAPGNVTDPTPTPQGGPMTTGKVPEPTGGDGSATAAKAEANAKASKSGTGN